MDIVKDILTACVGTARAPALQLKQRRGYFSVRSQVHAVVTMPPGGGKSTETDASVKNTVKAGNVTEAGLLGSINKMTGDFIPGAATLAAGKVLWIDEYQRMTENAKSGMLSLLEGSQAQRSLGFNLKEKLKKTTKYGSVCGVKGTGHFEVISRFSCLLTGTIKPSIRKQNYLHGGDSGEKTWMDAVMLLERFMHVNMSLDLKDFYRVVAGSPLFEIKDYSQYYMEPQRLDDYMDMWKWHQELIAGDEVSFIKTLPREALGFVTRNLLDVARMRSFGLALKNSQNFTPKNPFSHAWDDTFDSMKWWVVYPLFNVVANSLTFSEHTVFMNMISNNPKTQKEIAVELEISQPAISQIENKIESYHLMEDKKILEKYKLISGSPSQEEEDSI